MNDNDFWQGFLGGTFALLVWNSASRMFTALQLLVAKRQVQPQAPPDMRAGPQLPYPWETRPGVYAASDHDLAQDEPAEVRNRDRVRGPGY